MKDKLSRFSIISVGILSFGIILLVFAKRIFPIILPFLIAWFLAAATARPARSLAKKINAPVRIIRLIMSLVVTLFFFSAIGFLAWQATTALWGFLSDMARDNRLYDLLDTLLSSDVPLFGDLFPKELGSKIGEAIGRLVSGCLDLLAEWITSFAGVVPEIFLFVIVTLISLVYFALDYDKINAFLMSLLSDKSGDRLVKIKNNVISIIKKYILSYLLIMLITYFTLLVGFWIIGVDHALIIALFIAVLDILPILGVGTVLVPWSIFELVMGNRFIGIGLIILFVVNAVIRQFAEPKIVGKSLNLHPLITLMTIYVGYALFGFVGIIILPIVGVIVGALLKRDDSAKIS